jgi:hypothetical protein
MHSSDPIPMATFISPDSPEIERTFQALLDHLGMTIEGAGRVAERGYLIRAEMGQTVDEGSYTKGIFDALALAAQIVLEGRLP